MQKLTVKLPQNPYDILIHKGLLNDIGMQLKKVFHYNKISVITDSNVDGLYGGKLIEILKENGFLVNKIVVTSGEKSKSIDTAQFIYHQLLDYQHTRKDLIIAFGGGVVGDLAGFVAATFLRGVPFVQIPTTLLAQIDSSVGGKVGVNLDRGKNLIGSFYQPQGVFIDPNLLKTLEDRYLFDGMAEVIKYSCIKDEKLFENLLQIHSKKELFDRLEEMIKICCTIKSEIVQRDEKEQGERMLLNFGHTIGHGLEKYYNYNGYTHGEAVAIGMYHITVKSEILGETEKGTSEKIKKVLKKFYLPYKIQEVEKERLIEIIQLDKKKEDGSLNIILLKKIGQSTIKKIDQKEIEKYI
ncbi:3-dehydroquinate synthase [Garciella nitratireducens]|uniref:3-dehydroquinate synthase n=1 Tax=Garciella nitratireducens DSM 15102 TaxID=1121911 RepID=A0A1T4N247_9FIRM|nr:3-dehydroquinate synthase [Garciella nitratireducens]SJZ73363.1 3-dehydroquinate synthase [Garciella nitratireducens DSM 15102]